MKRLVKSDQYMCCLGKNHPCPMNVNNGYCTAHECQYMVISDNEFLKQYKLQTQVVLNSYKGKDYASAIS